MKDNGKFTSEESSEEPSLFSRFRKVPGDVKLLVEKRMELWALNIGELITGLLAESIYRLTGVVMLAVSGLLLLIALASFVGELVGNESLGYVIVAAPFLLLGLLFANKRPRFIVTRTQQQMMEQFYAGMEGQKSKILQQDSAEDSEGMNQSSEAKEQKNERH